MKRTKREYELTLDPAACYKMEYLHNESKASFESVEKWLYLGASARDSLFAKVGITTGDLRSRSSSSENPHYHLFCAFKCDNKIERSRLEAIENAALTYLDGVFVYPDGSTKRARHYESGCLSECFIDVDFLDFFVELHCYLHREFRNDFVLSGFENEMGDIEGEFLDCEFNKRRITSVNEENKYIRLILE